MQDPKSVVLIGEGYFEKLEDELKGPHVFIDKVTKCKLKKLQQDITQTNQPEYCQGPPANLGSPGHGNLKADQWRTCIEFDIPISVAQLWSKETCLLGSGSRMEDSGLRRRIPKGLGLSLCAVPS
jgi:hypothetical protein